MDYTIENGIAAVSELVPWEGNPNVMTDAEMAKLRRSLREYGFVDPVIARANDRLVIGGHQRLAAAIAEGMTEVPVRWVHGLSDASAKALNVALNKITGSPDMDKLSALLAELNDADYDPTLTGYDQDEIEQILYEASDHEGLTDPDEVPALPDETTTRLWDIWQLGTHRLICGDCTNDLVVNALMAGAAAQLCVTDPPWNVNYDKGGRVKIANDNLGDGFDDFVKKFCQQIYRVLQPGGALYMVMGTQEWPGVHGQLSDIGFKWSNTIIWLKHHFVMGRGDYHNQYEPIWYGVNGEEFYEPIFYGWRDGCRRLHPVEDRRQSNVWCVDKPAVSPEHPTTKPVELLSRAIVNSSKVGDVVLEPFCGSGSTLIAAEKHQRCCYAVELEPHYCDVIVQRWENFSGGKAALIGRNATDERELSRPDDHDAGRRIE